MAQFKYWSSFGQFRREVSSQRRYVRTPEADAFLRAIASTCKARLRPIAKGTRFWRAQLGSDWDKPHGERKFSVPVAHPPDRMKPLRDRAVEGRTNPKGIPCLYLASTASAAMSEMRPWVGATVSVAQFEIVRHLTVVDCSIFHNHLPTMPFQELSKVPTEQVDELVWAAIDGAFAEPITRTDDVADYAATQTIAEVFRHEEYDGVKYKSPFGAEAYNIALFDLDCAAQIDCKLCVTTGVDFKFEEQDFTRVGMLRVKW